MEINQIIDCLVQEKENVIYGTNKHSFSNKDRLKAFEFAIKVLKDMVNPYDDK